jgi:predicted DCC family thiol-disulfide oxidoreductase YuxK
MSNDEIVFIKHAQVVWPLTVYYDKSCDLCNSLMSNLKARDIVGNLVLVDCSPSSFDASQLPFSNIEFLKSIYAVDSIGNWLKEVDVVIATYRLAGMTAFSIGFDKTSFFMSAAYPLIARNRYILSKIGFHKLFDMIMPFFIDKKAKNDFLKCQECSQGKCDLN